MKVDDLLRSRHLSARLERGRALSVHFQLGLRAYESGDLFGVSRHRAAIGMLPEGGVTSNEFMALDWRAKWLEDRRDEARQVATEIAERFPGDPDALLELSQILSDLDEADNALAVLLEGTRRCADDPDLWYELGLAAERLEEWDLRRRAFHRVWELEHETQPTRRLFLSADEFVRVVEETLERLPPVAREAIGNVAIFVEDYPDEWIVSGDIADPRVLGIFDGPDRPTQQSIGAIVEGPARIYLFRWNIERICSSWEEAVEQVGITVLHEVGHYLGLDEEALHFRGLG